MPADGDFKTCCQAKNIQEQQTFSLLKMWESKKFSHNTKIRIIKSNVLSVPFMGVSHRK